MFRISRKHSIIALRLKTCSGGGVKRLPALGKTHVHLSDEGSNYMALSAKIRRVGDIAIIDLDGRITLGESTGLLRDNFRELLAQGSKKIVLNLARVSYVDSAGLGELVGVYTTAKNQGGGVKLLNLQKKLNDLLQVTKLETVFESYDDEQKAIQSFGRTATA